MDQSKYVASTEGAIRQGEILSSIEIYNLDVGSLGLDELLFTKIYHPYAIVVSQDCDLDWDFKAREQNAQSHKRVPTILFCQVTTAEQLKSSATSSEHWKRIVANKDERYQFFELVPEELDLLGRGLPELGIDFKRFFTIPTDEVYVQILRGNFKRRCRLNTPYLEHFTTRFHYFQSRVALPFEYQSI